MRAHYLRGVVSCVIVLVNILFQFKALLEKKVFAWRRFWILYKKNSRVLQMYDILNDVYQAFPVHYS